LNKHERFILDNLFIEPMRKRDLKIIGTLQKGFDLQVEFALLNLLKDKYISSYPGMMYGNPTTFYKLTLRGLWFRFLLKKKLVK